jgi:hypothetical protein
MESQKRAMQVEHIRTTLGSEKSHQGGQVVHDLNLLTSSTLSLAPGDERLLNHLVEQMHNNLAQIGRGPGLEVVKKLHELAGKYSK